MFLLWVSRCIPGLSIIALLFLVACSFPNAVPLPQWKALFPQSVTAGNASSDGSNLLTPWQKAFIAYLVFVHLNLFAFTVRLLWALFSVSRATEQILKPQLSDTGRQSGNETKDTLVAALNPIQKHPDPAALRANAAAKRDEVTHAIILPNYAEDIDTLRSTLDVLASHPRARSQYEVRAACHYIGPG